MKARSSIRIALLLVATAAAGRVDAACGDIALVGEICTFAGPTCPSGYMETSGQLLRPESNSPFFALLGSAFGGNGINLFGLPNLVGRIVMGTGQGLNLPNVALGQIGGAGALHQANVAAGDDVEAPLAQLPFLGVTQCIALEGAYPFRQ